MQHCNALFPNLTACCIAYWQCDMQIKAKAGQRQAIIIVGQSFLAQAHVGQRWSWRAKGFKLGPGNQRCVFKSEKSGREIQEIWPKKSGWRIQKIRLRGPVVPSNSGGPGFQKILGARGSKVPGGTPGFQKFPGAPGSGMIVSIIVCARCLFSYARCFYSYARWFLGVMCKMWPLI